jgi:hypothetical protein
VAVSSEDDLHLKMVARSLRVLGRLPIPETLNSDEKGEKGKGRPKVAVKPRRGEKTKPERSKGSKKSQKAD